MVDSAKTSEMANVELRFYLVGWRGLKLKSEVEIQTFSRKGGRKFQI